MVQPIDGAIDDDFLADFSKLPDRVWGLRSSPRVAVATRGMVEAGVV
jgi:hypothetical protein